MTWWPLDQTAKNRHALRAEAIAQIRRHQHETRAQTDDVADATEQRRRGAALLQPDGPTARGQSPSCNAVRSISR